jgi:hypothetical protein
MDLCGTVIMALSSGTFAGWGARPTWHVPPAAPGGVVHSSCAVGITVADRCKALPHWDFGTRTRPVRRRAAADVPSAFDKMARSLGASIDAPVDRRCCRPRDPRRRRL